MLPRTRAHRIAVLTAGLLAVAAPAAMADSIVYIDGGNVWSASPDGSKQGAADRRRPVALADPGRRRHDRRRGGHRPDPVVMAPDGRPLRTITTPPAKSGDGGTFAPRPVDLAFSPDGTKIAYAYVANSCPVGSTCGTIQRSIFYTDANVTTATPIDTYGNQFSVSSP